MKNVKEGNVEVVVPEDQQKPSKSKAFYNPRMELNRDLSVAVARVFSAGRKVRICEPLAATGIRAVRYAKEVNSKVFASDIKESSVELVGENAKLNNVNISIQRADANDALLGKKFDIVDLDPFGTPSPFIDAGLVAVEDKGLLCLTATDMRPLCGVTPKGPMPKYDNATALHTEYCHEAGIRILIGLAARRAEKIGKSIKPLLSLSTDHYLRVFLNVSEAKKGPEIGYICHCPKCGERVVQQGKAEKCSCGSAFKCGGPLWIGKLQDREFCEKVLAETEALELGTKKRLTKILGLIIGEADAPPTYFDYHKLYKGTGKSAPKFDELLEKLRQGGFTAVKTHFSPTAFRTDASVGAISRSL